MQTQLQFSSLPRWAEKWPPTNIHIKSPEPVNVTELRILEKKKKELILDYLMGPKYNHMYT